MGLGLKKLVQATGETQVEALPKGSGPTLIDNRTFSLLDDYDAGPAPATVGGELALTSSQNYQSFRIGIRCDIPSRPNITDMTARTELAYAFMYAALEQQSANVGALMKALGMGTTTLPTVETDLTEKLRPILQTVHQVLHPSEKP